MLDLKEFEKKVNEVVKTISNSKVSLVNVGAFGLATTLAFSIGVGKLVLDKKHMSLENTRVITQISNDLAVRDLEIAELESAISDIESRKSTLEQEKSVLEQRLKETEEKLEQTANDLASKENLNEFLYRENEGLRDDMGYYLEEPASVLQEDLSKQSELNGLKGDNYTKIAHDSFIDSTDEYPLNFSKNEDANALNYFEINLPKPIPKNYNYGDVIPFSEVRSPEDDDLVTRCQFFSYDLAVTDEEDKKIYFNQNFNQVYSAIYDYYEKEYGSESANELMRSVIKDSCLVSVKSMINYSDAKGIEPNKIQLENGNYVLNYETNDLAVAIASNNDVLIACDKWKFVGERNKISSYKLEMLNDIQVQPVENNVYQKGASSRVR